MSSIPATPAAQPAASAKTKAASGRPAPFSPVSAIIRKELMENLKWIAGSLILQSIVVGIYMWNAFTVRDYGSLRPPMLHPDSALFDQGMQTICAVFAIGTALILAALQIFTERTFDLRAFYRHRAISPSRLFLGKALAALIIYSACIGFPILLFIAWSATSPAAGFIFDISFAQIYLVLFFGGIAYYFATLIVAVREARWWMSRPVPIAAAALATLCTFSCSSFHYALLGVLAVDVILAIAAWNSYVRSGVDIPLGQPPAAPKPAHANAPLQLLRKFSLPAVILSALTLISCLLVVLNGEVLYLANQAAMHDRTPDELYGEFRYYRYVILPGGTPAIYTTIARRSTGQSWSYERVYTDLDRKPIPAAATSDVEWLEESIGFQRKPVDYFSNRFVKYYDPASKFAILSVGAANPEEKKNNKAPEERWYWIEPRKLFVGYNTADGKQIATIGQAGYSTTQADPFPPAARYDGALLFLNNRALQFDVEDAAGGPKFTLSPRFAAPAGETISAITSAAPRRFPFSNSGEDEGTPWPTDKPHVNSIMVTDKSFHIYFDPTSSPINTSQQQSRETVLPIDHQFDDYDASINYYPRSGRVALRYTKPVETGSQQSSEYLYVYAINGDPITHYTLPPLPPERLPILRPVEKTALFTVGLIDAFRNPWIAAQFPLESHETYDDNFNTASTLPLTVSQFAGFSSIAGIYYFGLFLPILLAAVLTFSITTRYGFTLAGRIGWTLAALAFGPLALITLLFTQPFPARIVCPSCKAKRLPTLPLCPHCQAPFPIPAANGTEIFASAPQA